MTGHGSEATLAELQRRLERVEEQLAAGAAQGPSTLAAENFWVLEGLRTLPEPSIVYAGRVELARQPPVEWQMGHLAEDVLDREWADLAGGLGALGHPVRLGVCSWSRVVRPPPPRELTRLVDLGSTGQIYHHLRQLVAAGWLRTRSKGRHSVPSERVVPLLVILAACS